MPGRIKGTAVVVVVKMLRLELDGSGLPERLQRYFREPVIASEWYPEQDWLALLRELARTLPGRGVEANPWEWLGHKAAQRDTGLVEGNADPQLNAILREGSGVYRQWLRAGEPDATLKNVARLWSLWHDSGTQSVTHSGPGRASLVIADYAPLSANQCQMHGAYLAEFLRQSGAREVAVKHSACVLSDAASCSWECQWSDPSQAQANRRKWDTGLLQRCPKCRWINGAGAESCSSCGHLLRR